MKNLLRCNKKIILIPIMAIFLGYRIVSLTGLSSLSDLQAVSDLAVVASQNLQLGETMISGDKQRDWPSRSLEDVLQHDPFARPQPEVEELTGIASTTTEDAEEEKSFKLKAIYRTRTGTVALVGSEIVSVGQRLQDGSLVVAIADDSITLRPGQTD